MECLRDYDYLNLLILPLQFLESQPFVSVQQVDDAAILEAVFLEDILQDMIIAMGIGTQVGYLAVTPLQAGGCYAFTVFRTCQTVDNAIRADIVYPFTVVDLHIGRVVSLYKGESSYDILFFIEAYIAVSVLDIFLDNFLGGVAAGPLFHVPVFAHDAFSLLEDVHEGIELCDVCFSNLYHNVLAESE